MSTKNKLSAKWSAKEKSILYSYPRKQDGGMLAAAFEMCKLLDNKTLLQELEDRGYDITTLKFSIEKLKD